MIPETTMPAFGRDHAEIDRQTAALIEAKLKSEPGIGVG
jgi:hypothetical protein